MVDEGEENGGERKVKEERRKLKKGGREGGMAKRSAGGGNNKSSFTRMVSAGSRPAPAAPTARCPSEVTAATQAAIFSILCLLSTPEGSHTQDGVSISASVS